jgi:hypothetical protein
LFPQAEFIVFFNLIEIDSSAGLAENHQDRLNAANFVLKRECRIEATPREQNRACRLKL